MYRRNAAWLHFIFSLALIAAVPYQAERILGLPWWAWLIIIIVIVLVTFGIILGFDWTDAGRSRHNNEETK